MITCNFDGACGPVNPGGEMGAGVVVYENGKIIYERSKTYRAHEYNTNNVAEYLALTILLDFFIDRGLTNEKIKIMGDSMLVVKQMNGKWRIKSGYYYTQAIIARDKFLQFTNTTIEWIPREQNGVADELSK